MTLLNYLHNHHCIDPNLPKVTGNFFFHLCGIENPYENLYQVVFNAMWFVKIKTM